MAHELEIVNGDAQMFWVGDVAPWHRLGKRLIQAPTVEEGIRAAGLDWEVGLKDLFTMGENGLYEMVDHKATYRKSDNKTLGVVGPSYEPLQNIDAFNFFNPFLEAKQATLETAGSLFDGKRVWILAKICRDDSVIVAKSDDRVAKYILLSNSHDGSLAVRVGFTPVRVVCNNTLTMAINAKKDLLRIRHTAKMKESLIKVQEIMNVANATFEATAEQYRALASLEINQLDLARYVRKVFAVKDDEENPDANKTLLGKIVPLFEHGKGNDLEGVKGTMWAGYNAITEYLTHFRGKDDERRFDNVMFGQGNSLNQKALTVALEMVKAA